MKDKTTAALFAFFLGGLGVHHFYLGNTGRGVLYLIFCWTLIPAFIAFIEALIFLTLSVNDFNVKYNMNAKINYQQQQPNNKGENYLATKNNITTNIADEIKKLHDLREAGILTDDEFEQQKRKLL